MLLILFKLHLLFPRKIGINRRLIWLNLILGLERVRHLSEGLICRSLLIQLLLLIRILGLIL